MRLAHTEIVCRSDERPARKDGTCFYCGEGMGLPHKEGCVCVQKAVTVRMTLDVVIPVPADWDKGNIEFARNEGSWCCDNILTDLGEWAGADDQNCGCSCGAMKIEYLRDATAEDRAGLPDLCEKKPLQNPGD